jgi:hypothetical protein
MPKPFVPLETCSKFVESAARSCQPLVTAPPEAAHPNWDAIAVSLTSQSNAIAWGSAVLATIFAVAGFAWAKVVARDAEREARDMAKTCAEAYIGKWLAQEAPGIIRERVDLILDATLGSGDDTKAADDLGVQAG